MKIESQAFKEGGTIPSKYTCDGIDVSPQLEWSDVPVGTKSFALICDDPDAPMGTYVHWVIYNIPADERHLIENVPKTDSLKNGTLQGMNDFKKAGYGGPCPPGGTHRYYFKLYALDKLLGAGSGISKNDLLKTMEGNILAEGQLMGRYTRA